MNKGYSLVDCISMTTRRRHQRISEFRTTTPFHTRGFLNSGPPMKRPWACFRLSHPQKAMVTKDSITWSQVSGQRFLTRRFPNCFYSFRHGAVAFSVSLLSLSKPLKHKNDVQQERRP